MQALTGRIPLEAMKALYVHRWLWEENFTVMDLAPLSHKQQLAATTAGWVIILITVSRKA